MSSLHRTTSCEFNRVALQVFWSYAPVSSLHWAARAEAIIFEDRWEAAEFALGGDQLGVYDRGMDGCIVETPRFLRDLDCEGRAADGRDERRGKVAERHRLGGHHPHPAPTDENPERSDCDCGVVNRILTPEQIRQKFAHLGASKSPLTQ